ncbi:ATP-binding protein [Streptomyces sp. ISL-66]|uniref:ATP-binding protein n=1 Tax=Streptomyces sp. ISL-66 TaxID=2819186 RepID=UPI001C19CE30|nr:ATP-binding protein [Streptomyces sp. ISL-66]MBT2470104.1 ATP-binding protein [Streptomyces sp. ISL-66]
MAQRSKASPIPTAPPRVGINCAEARDITRDVLAETNPLPGREQDVLTAVSELVANALRHAGTVSAFNITARPGTITVQVSDPSPQLPVTRLWAPAQPGGFGWRLINQLADTTSINVREDGKTITITFTTPC